MVVSNGPSSISPRRLTGAGRTKNRKNPVIVGILVKRPCFLVPSFKNLFLASIQGEDYSHI